MALISCPDCKKDVSENAETCINCGCPISSYVTLVKSQDVSCGECGNKYPFDKGLCPKCGCINGKKILFYDTEKIPQQSSLVTKPQKQNSGTAAVLSLFIPGAGQIYKGNLAHGLGWLVATVIGYAMFVIPGVILHILCIMNAHKSKD